MAIVRAQVIFQGKSNKPEDVFVNTYHFNTQGTTTADFEVCRDHLIELYNVAGPLAGSRALAMDLSNVILRTANSARIKLYVIPPGPPPAPPAPYNPPAADYTWTLGASGASTGVELPAEMAICASFYALVNRPRYRGRVYLGPWQIGVSQDEAVTDRANVLTAIRTGIASTFGRLVNKGANTSNLAVYSRADGTARVVTNGWVDDAWDVQRRRGQDATVRTLFP